jgi:hypothetical protein
VLSGLECRIHPVGALAAEAATIQPVGRSLETFLIAN